MSASPIESGAAGNGGAPSNSALDRRLVVLETRVDVMLPTLATKQDLAELRVDLLKTLNEQFWWIIALFATLFIGMLGANYAMWNSMERGRTAHEAGRDPASHTVGAASPERWCAACHALATPPLKIFVVIFVH